MKTDKGGEDNNNVDIPPKWNDIRNSSDMNELSEIRSKYYIIEIT